VKRKEVLMKKHAAVLLMILALACSGDVENIGEDRFQLSNGLEVLLLPAEKAGHTVLIVLYDVGGLHDPQGRSGMAHLIEQVYVTAGTGERPSRTVEEYVREYPRGWNAQTGDDYTLFAAVFEPDRLPRELEDAAYRMGDLRITEEDMRREKNRIATELANMYGRVPALAAFNHARELVVPSPEGARRGGVTEQIEAVDIGEARDYWERYYKPVNARLVLAGKFDPGKAKNSVEGLFGSIPPGEEAPPPAPRGTARRGITVERTAPSVSADTRTVVSIAWAAPGPGTDFHIPFLVLVGLMWDRAMGRPMSMEDMPIRYAPLDDPWVVSQSSPVEAGETPEEVAARLRAFVAETLDGEITARDIARITRVYGWALGLSGFSGELLAQNPYAAALGKAMRANQGIDRQDLEMRLKALSTEEIRRAGQAVFAEEESATVIATF
jgi:zinc protease